MGFLDLFRRKKKKTVSVEEHGTPSGRRDAPPPPVPPPTIKKVVKNSNSMSQVREERTQETTSRMLLPRGSVQAPVSASKRSKVHAPIRQEAEDVRDDRAVTLHCDGLHYHSGGVFSNVYRGHMSSPTDKDIAIKKTWPRETQRSDEMHILAGMRRASPRNVIKLLYRFKSVSRDNVTCESFVFEYMPQTLDNTIRDMHNSGTIDYIDIKIYMWQLFNGLHFLAENRIAHRDIKPINVLVNPATAELHIGDFGSAKIIGDQERSSAYQVTRYYRPPEMLLGSDHYTHQIDVWSAGCVLGEFIKGRVLFRGSDSAHQVALVQIALGMPTPEDLRAMKLNTDDKNVKRLLKPQPHYGLLVSLRLAQEGVEPPRLGPDLNGAIELLKQILVYNPERRLCGPALLEHAYFDDVKSARTLRRNRDPANTHLVKQTAECLAARPFQRTNSEEDSSRAAPPPSNVRHREGLPQPPSKNDVDPGDDNDDAAAPAAAPDN